MSEPLEFFVQRDIHRQVDQIFCDFASYEQLRRMNRQEFRTHLRERLREFHDQILSVWDEQFGSKE